MAISKPPKGSHSTHICATLPPKPYTDYTIFFRLERTRILQSSGIIDEEILSSLDPNHRDAIEFPRPLKYQNLDLPPYWYSSLHKADTEKKRKHRKREGRLDLKTLSKTISANWKNSDPLVVEYCRKLAKAELQKHYALVEDMWNQQEQEDDKNKAATRAMDRPAIPDGTMAMAFKNFMVQPSNGQVDAASSTSTTPTSFYKNDNNMNPNYNKVKGYGQVSQGPDEAFLKMLQLQILMANNTNTIMNQISRYGDSPSPTSGEACHTSVRSTSPSQKTMAISKPKGSHSTHICATLPHKPYTDYTIFFHLERARIVQSSGMFDVETFSSLDPNHVDALEFPRPNKYQNLDLPPYWYSSLHKAAIEKKRKRQGRMDYLNTLSKTISANWRNADPSIVEYCRKLASAGLQKYDELLLEIECRDYTERVEDTKNKAAARAMELPAIPDSTNAFKNFVVQPSNNGQVKAVSSTSTTNTSFYINVNNVDPNCNTVKGYGQVSHGPGEAFLEKNISMPTEERIPVEAYYEHMSKKYHYPRPIGFPGSVDTAAMSCKHELASHLAMTKPMASSSTVALHAPHKPVNSHASSIGNMASATAKRNSTSREYCVPIKKRKLPADIEEGRGNSLPALQEMMCSVNGCTKWRQNGGVCASHADILAHLRRQRGKQQHQSKGALSSAEDGARISDGAKRYSYTCIHVGCDNIVTQRGVCIMHGKCSFEGGCGYNPTLADGCHGYIQSLAAETTTFSQAGQVSGQPGKVCPLSGIVCNY